MKFRRAASLVATFERHRVVLQNFLTRERFACSGECLEFLAKLDDWCPAAKLFDLLPDVDRASIAAQIPELVGAGVLVVFGTPQAQRDEHYRREWLWGTNAGFFHFSIRDTRFIVGSDARAFMRKRKTWRKSPALIQPNKAIGGAERLPRTDLIAEPFAVMSKRRSRRDFVRSSITRQVLADCLFAGNGVVGFADYKDFGRLPLAMTPSGGARNPFELYIYAAKVEGLEIGFYHYDAVQRSLARVKAGKADVKKMLGGQRWPTKAAAIVFMVAHFPRSMWKYHMPMAYRVVAMEAGFIGQNIALAATHHGLSAVPSGALNDSLIEGHLGIPAVESAVLLTMSIGRPKAQVS